MSCSITGQSGSVCSLFQCWLLVQGDKLRHLGWPANEQRGRTDIKVQIHRRVVAGGCERGCALQSVVEVGHHSSGMRKNEQPGQASAHFQQLSDTHGGIKNIYCHSVVLGLQ